MIHSMSSPCAGDLSDFTGGCSEPCAKETSQFPPISGNVRMLKGNPTSCGQSRSNFFRFSRDILKFIASIISRSHSSWAFGLKYARRGGALSGGLSEYGQPGVEPFILARALAYSQ